MWSESLCRKDSDGDGRTNGEELCDPECKWTFQPGNSEQPKCHDSSLPTHPGLLHSLKFGTNIFRCLVVRPHLLVPT